MEHTANVPETTVRLTIRNARAAPVTFSLEPWADEYEMPPGAAFELVVRGPAEGSMEVDYGEERITAYAWSGSVAQLFHDGVELGAGLWPREPVPPVPPSMGVGGFVRTFFRA
jgi:hypothetical protein